jgi:hypothetical protein
VNEESAFAAPNTDKEVVAYRGGWGFRLPEQHQIQLSADKRQVSLTVPDRGARYHVDHIDDAGDEFRVHVGPKLGGHALGDGEPEYPFPLIQHELDRLKREYLELGGDWQRAEAWAPGASYDDHTSWLRSEIRRLRAAE